MAEERARAGKRSMYHEYKRFLEAYRISGAPLAFREVIEWLLFQP